MDIIELKKYHRSCGLVDEQNTRSKDILSKTITAFRNATLTKERLSEKPTEFYEFFINDKPLSEILTEFCKLDKTLLDNWVGLLGSFSNKKAELNYIKRLILEQISEQEIRDVFPKDLDKFYLDNGIENYREELADEEIIIYGCAECGDYGCGGFKIKANRQGNQFVWTYNEEENILQFFFDEHQYFDTFDSYRKTIENENN